MDRLSLLIVDDDAIFLDRFEHILGTAFPEATIHKAEDAATAGAQFNGRPFDCVIFGHRPPALDGVACAKKLRKLNAYTPSILATACGSEELAARALLSGMTDYIPKSKVTVDSVRRAITRAIQTSNQRRMIDEQQQELETFAFALAHDFKQSLRQIMTFSQLVSLDIDPSPGGELEVHLKFLNSAANRLAKLVDVMAQYTLLNQPVSLSPVTLREAFDSAVELAGDYIRERKASVILDSYLVLMANHVLLAQSLQNLIINGLKYNKSATPRVIVAGREEEGRPHIHVVDNGIGIERQYINTIFAPLVRLHTDSEYSGTGLGLALVRKAMTAQFGSVSCRSTLGLGSEFILTMRRPPARQRTKAPASEPQVLEDAAAP